MIQRKKNRSIPAPGKIFTSIIDFGRKCSGFARSTSVFSSSAPLKTTSELSPKLPVDDEPKEVSRWSESEFKIDWNLVENLDVSRLPELSYMIAEEPEMSTSEFRAVVFEAESEWLRETEPNLGFTAFHVAITYRAKSLMRILMSCSEADFLINTAAEDGITPLHLACQLGYKDMIDMLVTHELTKVNQRDSFGSSALENCLMTWRLDLAKIILEGRSSVKPRRKAQLFKDLNDHKRNGVLGSEAAEIAEMLVKKGVKMKPLVEDLLTRVHLEAPMKNSRNETEMVSTKVVNALNPIVIAMTRGNTELLSCFLENVESYLTSKMLSELWKFNTKLLHEGMKFMGHFDPSNELFQRGNEVTRILSEAIDRYEKDHPNESIRPKVSALTSSSKQKGYRCSRCNHSSSAERELFDLMINSSRLKEEDGESESYLEY